MASMLSSSGSICSFACYNPKTTTTAKCFFKPLNFSSPTPTITLSTRFSSHSSSLLRPKFHKFCIPSSEYDKSCGLPAETQPNIPLVENTIDIQLPRRSLLVKFTCNSCGERTERLINRLAYERGTVFVQAAGSSRRWNKCGHYVIGQPMWLVASSVEIIDMILRLRILRKTVLVYTKKFHLCTRCILREDEEKKLSCHISGLTKSKKAIVQSEAKAMPQGDKPPLLPEPIVLQ